MNWLHKIFKRKPKFFNLPSGECAVEAFRLNGKSYYHFADNHTVPAGRGLCALAIYEEFKMRCTEEYLQKHIRATEIILSAEKGKIDLGKLALINANLKERLSLAPMPDYIYRLASVIYFDQTENPYTYDFEYNRKKIEQWKKEPGVLDFFLTKPFKDLMPRLNTSGLDAQTYFMIAQQVEQIHQRAYPVGIYSNS